MNFEAVTKFEQKLAEFFGAPHAIAVDSCTHGVELSLRATRAILVDCPVNTYLSIPFLAPKLGLTLRWRKQDWVDFYYVAPTVVDAAVLWRRGSYVPGTLMSISFQYQKHLSLGRGGVILTDNPHMATLLKKMSYDGREPNKPWREQKIDTVGYHYYMTPETAQLGLDKFDQAAASKPRQWTTQDWPDLTKMPVFQHGSVRHTYGAQHGQP